jgi:hypothetical protein
MDLAAALQATAAASLGASALSASTSAAASPATTSSLPPGRPGGVCVMDHVDVSHNSVSDVGASELAALIADGLVSACGVV